MNCACHGKPMGWNRDKRCTKNGGFWECREKRRENNAKRIKVFGTTVYIPNRDVRNLALRLREERKNGCT